MEKLAVPGSSSRTDPPAPGWRIGSFAALAGWFGVGVGSIVLMGWLVNLPALKSILPGLALMQPNTALSLALAGLALLGLGWGGDGPRPRRIASVFAGLAGSIGMLTLAEYASGVDLGIDLLLFGKVPGSEGPSSPGRMSFMTATCIASLGAALLLLDAKAHLLRQASQAFALLTTLLALLDLIGYAYGVRFLYMVNAYSTMALHTASTLFVLGLGTLVSRPGSGLMRRFLAEDAGGWLLRNLLPLAVALPLLSGGLRVAGEESGLFNPRFGSAVLVLGNIMTLIGLLWWTSGRLSRLDRDRRQAERIVGLREAWLRTTLTSIGDAVIVTDSEGRVTFMNPVAEELTGWTQADATGQFLDDVFRIVDETTRNPADDPASRALREGVIVGLANHTILISRGGAERPIDDSAAPIRDGRLIIGAVLVFRDMTERRRAERELEGRERQFRTLADSIPHLAWMAEPDGDIFWYNRRWYDYTGTTIEQMAGWGWSLVHDPDELPKVIARWKASIETGEPFEMVFPLKGIDGEFRPFLTRVMPVKDDEGRVARWFGTNTDVTEAKRAEDGLREARSRLESTLSAGEVGTWEFDVLNNVVRADSNLARMFGVGPEEAAGGPLDAYTKAIHPDDRGRVVTAIGRTLESGEGYEEEYRLVLPGKAERRVVARGRVERDGSGLAVRLPGIVMDVTGQRRAEAELRASEDRRRLALDSAGLGTWSIDPATNVLTTDERFRTIFLGSPAPIGLREAFAVIHPDDRERVRASVAAAMSPDDPAPYVVEYRVVHPDGTVRWVFAKGRANFEQTAGGRRLVSFDGTAMDISERKAMEDELRLVAADLSEADHRKDEFLATLAHELRNPLAPIRNGLQIMKMAGDQRTIDESRSLMERQVTHMVRLIDDLMDISRITRNKLELRRERVDLAVVVRNAVETSRPLIDAEGHELAVTLPARPILVDADVTRLSQVFSNLLNNAAKYTERGGDIALVAERQGSDVVVTVRDNGVGIPPEMVPRLFDMFTQVDRSLERSQGGLGIGLSLVKTLVGMHGGSVEARSGGHGLGSEFVVRLPVVLDASSFPAAPEADRRMNGPTTALRILVVDDNVDSARTLARLLKLLGHEARTAHDGGGAVEIAEQYRPGLMLLDIGLPVMNGYEVARAIRGQQWGRDVVIVALTGWGQEDDRRRSKEAGIDDHLVKPVDPATLERLLSEMRSEESPSPIVTP